MFLPPLRKKKPHERVLPEDGLTFALWGEQALLEPGHENAMSPAGEVIEAKAEPDAAALGALGEAVSALKALVAGMQEDETQTTRLELLMEELKSYDNAANSERPTGDSNDA